MPNAVSFSAQCPTCHNEVSQDPHDPDEVRRLLREDQLHFYCDLCDHEWEPSHQELANVEYIIAREQDRLAVALATRPQPAWAVEGDYSRGSGCRE